MSFSENLKNLLEIKEIQVKELAAGTGISKNTLDNYLSGQKSLPNVENAIKIAQFLRVSVEYLASDKTGNNEQNDELKYLLNDLYKLSSEDFNSIKAIIHSLAK